MLPRARSDHDHTPPAEPWRPRNPSLQPKVLDAMISDARATPVCSISQNFLALGEAFESNQRALVIPNRCWPRRDRSFDPDPALVPGRRMVATPQVREAGRLAGIAKADARAAALAPMIAEIRATGNTTPYAIAAALTARGIPTARGLKFWSEGQVRSVLDRLDRLSATRPLDSRSGTDPLDAISSWCRSTQPSPKRRRTIRPAAPPGVSGPTRRTATPRSC
jgi:hypothetical protein